MPWFRLKSGDAREQRAPRRLAASFTRLALLVFLCFIVLSSLAQATAVRYRGSVFRGVTSESAYRGGHTMNIRVSLPVFPENDRAQIESILTDVFTNNLIFVTPAGKVVNSTIAWIAPHRDANTSEDERDSGSLWHSTIAEVMRQSMIEVRNGGREVFVVLAPFQYWNQPPGIAVVVVPCLPLSLFESLSQFSVEDLPSSCVAGDAFIVYHKAPLQVNLDAWQPVLENSLFVTGSSIAVPLLVDLELLPREKAGDQFTVERRLRLMEGETCLHTRPAFVHGSFWDMRHNVYRFTPHRGGTQSLCFTPFPEAFPFLHLKLADSFTITGPEGVSTDPPQVLAGREFVATVYGTNLTELDTAVITDELCADFTTQSVYFVELFFSSASRVSFYGSFHKRGIYHVCYHRDGAPTFVRVATVVVERGGEVGVTRDGDSILIDQDIGLTDSASLTQLKVQDKGHLDLKGRTVNVSYFVWTGGTISGKGSIQCMNQAKITTQGYETRVLQVPLYNYGDMTIDVQRMALEHDGAIHNHGNLTLVVPSMGADGISSLLSQNRRNAITNYAGAVLRIIALDRSSYALLTSRFTILDGVVVVMGYIHATDWSTSAKMSLLVRRAAHLTVYNSKLAGLIDLEQDSQISMMDGTAFVSATVRGSGLVAVAGDDVLLDSLTLEGRVAVVIGGHGKEHAIAVSLYGTTTFGFESYVAVSNTTFVTSTGLAKLLFTGALVCNLDETSFSGNVVIQIAGFAVMYGDSRRSTQRNLDAFHGATHEHSAVSSLFVTPHATVYSLDLADPSAPPRTHAALPSIDRVPDSPTINASMGIVKLPVSNPHSYGKCDSHLVLSEFVTMSGRLVLYGCHAVPSGITLSGSIERLVAQEDWDAILAAACRAQVQHMIPLCQLSHIPTPIHTGLNTLSEFYVRSASLISMDELHVQSMMRSVGFLDLHLNSQLTIRPGGVLHLDGGGNVETPLFEVDGVLRIGIPAKTALDVDTLRVSEKGVVALNSASEPCTDALHKCLHGELNAVNPGSITCAIFEDVAPDPNAPHLFSSDDSLALRKRVLGSLPLGIACPPEVLDRAYWELEFAVRTFSLSTYEHVANQPSNVRKLLLTLLGLLLTLAPLLFLLRVWKLSVRDWYTDLLRAPPLRLTMTWSELGYNTWNYLGLCAILTIHLQNSMSAFHPAMPAPLPFVATLCIRSQNLLMPHRWHSPLRLIVASLWIISWSIMTVYMNLHRHRAATLKRKNTVRKTWTSSAFSFITNTGRMLMHLFLFFQLPIMSFFADGVACSTLFPDVSTCAPYQRPWIAMMSAVAFVCGSVLLPWSLYNNQMRVSRLGTRIKIAWVSLMFSIQLFHILMWKIFFFNPTTLSVISLLLEMAQSVLCWRVDMMAYANFNVFFRHTQLATVSIHALVVFHTIRFRLGFIHVCTDGDNFFKGAIFLNCAFLFFSFWTNILYAEHPANSSSGNPAIDAMLRSIVQTHHRIADLKLDIYASSDTLQRENTLNAIAQLRIEFLEKQERYHHALDHALQEFHFGRAYNAVMRRDSVNGSLLSQQRYLHPDDSLATFEGLLTSSPTSVKAGGLLTVEEMETFNCGPALGKGSYGTVHLGILSSGRLVAVKYVDVADGSPEALERVKAEVNTLRELSHPNIIRYYGAHTIGETMMVFMEFAVGGSLTSIVRKFETLTEAVMQLYTYQILCGLQYLHQRDVVHRDIKGENILIDGLGVAKLADFGCSKSLANIANHSMAGCGTLVGSPFWMAPEVIRSEAYGTKADIWSVGCTVVEMLNGGEPPWRSEFDNAYSAMFYVGSTTDIPSTPEETSEQCRDFLSHCFERDVSKRATADDLLQHPWLSAVRHPEMSSSPSLGSSTENLSSTLHSGRRAFNMPPSSPLSRRRSVFFGSSGDVVSSQEMSRQHTAASDSLSRQATTQASLQQTPLNASDPLNVRSDTDV